MLGRLAPEAFLGGEMALDGDGARRAVRKKVGIPLGLEGEAGLCQAASGILAIANLTMANAVKKISLERGYDTRDFALIAYGGAGPLHGAEIAGELHIPQVIVPPEPGNFAAIGMLLADARMDESRTFLGELDERAISEMEQWFAQAEKRAEQNLRRETGAREIRFERHAELRYRGQVHSVRTPLGENVTPERLRRAFEELYRVRYGHAQNTIAVEIVGFHAIGAAPTGRPAIEKLHRANIQGRQRPRTRSVQFGQAGGMLSAAVYQRGQLPSGFAANGPAVIEEYGSTTLIGPSDRFTIGELGEIMIRIGGESGSALHG
jgi:N-methylhydantoinase A